MNIVLVFATPLLAFALQQPLVQRFEYWGYAAVWIGSEDVAIKAARGGTLQLVTFYHDGKRVSEAPTRRMAALMGLAGE